ncbi:MAG TPA: FHA domain-containing protein [Methylomirabilota bacterium]
MEPVMLVEVLDGHGRARVRHRIAASGVEGACTVGRSAECDVVLDDPFVAAVHARITVNTDGDVFVSDLDTVNGVEIRGQRLHGVQRERLVKGVVRVGRTRLRVRTAQEVIPPERVDRGRLSWPTPSAEGKVLGAGFSVSLAATVFAVWTNTERSRDLSTALVMGLLTTLAMAGLWISLWALASRVAYGESRWVRHATTLFVAYAGLLVVDLMVEIVNGALGLHLPRLVTLLALGIATSVALSRHLVNASPMRLRTALVLGVAIPTIVLTATVWVQAHGENRNPGHIADYDQMVPPALALRHGLPLDRFAAGLADLKAKADAKRAFVEREDPSPDDDDTD